MKLNDVFKVCEVLNINFYRKAYGTLGHEFSRIYPYPANHMYARSENFLEIEGPRFAEVKNKYGNCKVVELYGFDDGLTAVIKNEE